MTQSHRHPTILDVARAAGVSKSTVSNVIRGVAASPATRTRVLEAVARVGYRPNAVARNLVRRRTTTVGILLGDLANPFYSELAKLVGQRLTENGYATTIGNTDGRPARERELIESLLEQRVAGILMLQFSGERSALNELRAQGVPVVVVSCWEERSDCVAVDDAAGVELGVRHLVELGHRRIAYLSSDLVELKTDQARFEGYRSALAGAGLTCDESLILRWEHPAYLRSGLDLIRELQSLLSGASPPTAFFVSNDLVAIDLIETLEQLGFEVPEELSVVGFDNIALAGLARVSLTTVAQPRDELARAAVEILLGRIEGVVKHPVRQVRLTPQLFARGSTAPPRTSTRAVAPATPP